LLLVFVELTNVSIRLSSGREFMLLFLVYMTYALSVLPGSEKQQQHLEAMITLANFIIDDGPIVETQRLAAKYKAIKELPRTQAL
jgi:hypothetical protein